MSAQGSIKNPKLISEKLSQRISQLQADEVLDVSKLNPEGTGAKKIKIDKLPYTRHVLQSTIDGQIYPIYSNNNNGLEILLSFVPLTDVVPIQVITPHKSAKQYLEEKLSSLTDDEVLDVTKINVRGLKTRKMVPPKNTENWYVAGNYPVISRDLKGFEVFTDIIQPEYLTVISTPRTERKKIKDLMLARLAEVPEGKHLDITELQIITRHNNPDDDDILRGTRIITLPYDLSGWNVYKDYPVAYRNDRGPYNNAIIIPEMFAHALGFEPEDMDFYPRNTKLKVKPWSALYNLQRAYDEGRVLDVSKLGQSSSIKPARGARMINKPTAEWSTKKYILDLPVVSDNDEATISFLTQLDAQDPGNNYVQRFMDSEVRVSERSGGSEEASSSVGELLATRSSSSIL